MAATFITTHAAHEALLSQQDRLVWSDAQFSIERLNVVADYIGQVVQMDDGDEAGRERVGTYLFAFVGAAVLGMPVPPPPGGIDLVEVLDLAEDVVDLLIVPPKSAPSPRQIIATAPVVVPPGLQQTITEYLAEYPETHRPQPRPR